MCCYNVITLAQVNETAWNVSSSSFPYSLRSFCPHKDTTKVHRNSKSYNPFYLFYD